MRLPEYSESDQALHDQRRFLSLGRDGSPRLELEGRESPDGPALILSAGVDRGALENGRILNQGLIGPAWVLMPRAISRRVVRGIVVSGPREAGKVCSYWSPHPRQAGRAGYRERRSSDPAGVENARDRKQGRAPGGGVLKSVESKG